MADLKTNRSSLYKEVSSLRTLSRQEPPPQTEEDGDDLPLQNYFKWVGLLSVIALLVGFCTAAVTR